MLLLTGASGFLGRFVAEQARQRRLPLGVVGRRPKDAVAVDLAAAVDVDALRRDLAALVPSAVLHVAACSRVGDCARDPELAQRVNVDATAALCAALPAAASLVFVSTDLVFGGDRAPYRSGDPVDPKSVYGQTKALAERAVADAGGVVVRLPLLFGPSADGQAGATDMIRRAVRSGQPVSLYDNEFRTPLHGLDAAAALLDLADRAKEHAGRILHVAGPERVSRYGLAERLAAVQGLALDAVMRGHCEDADRPRDVALVSDVATRTLDTMLADA